MISPSLANFCVVAPPKALGGIFCLCCGTAIVTFTSGVGLQRAILLVMQASEPNRVRNFVYSSTLYRRRFARTGAT